MLVHSQRAVDAVNTAERRASKWTTEGEGETEKPAQSSGTSGCGEAVGSILRRRRALTARVC